MNRVWRQTLWDEGGGTLRDLEQALGAPIRARRAGWEIRGATGRVWIAGGIRGVRTRLWRADGQKRIEAGWMEPADIVAWLGPAKEG
ncbi:MAG: hypothetical protein H6737_12875 [Alphaproteobacteria bacterium]|nr:hypothetical protein [Alphaproteobacteria bacterium]